MQPTRKQQLLRKHRRIKRSFLVLLLLAVLVLFWCAGLWVTLGALLLVWLVHEARFSDHLFYSARDHYHYAFAADVRTVEAQVQQGKLLVAEDLCAYDTCILELTVGSTWLGYWFDPYVRLGADRQYLEPGVGGRRYLNLSGLSLAGLPVQPRFCRIHGLVRIHAWRNPDYSAEPLMIIAPHADDAELAAFGLYSRAKEVSILTLTQGEIEAEAYERLGLSPSEAAVLKGRLRAWDSMAIPLWGGVPSARSMQLGYYCMQLAAMAAHPKEAFGSLVSGAVDVRTVRQANALCLPADQNGTPSWNNLIADLVGALENFRPRVVVTPHPELDPHSDHIAATQALQQAIAQSSWKPRALLLYANHLHDNDRWPMGPAGAGIMLPPVFNPLPEDALWSPCLPPEVQLDKALALGMQHDLQAPLSRKQRLRRLIQQALRGRRWPVTGENEFFRKAVRRHELFWVRRLEGAASVTEPSSTKSAT